MAGGPALVHESVLSLGDLLVRDESLVRDEVVASKMAMMQCPEAAHSLATVLASWIGGLYLMCEQALMGNWKESQGLVFAYGPAMGPDV